jgi:energy-coupling factor transporter ATP-binding protein EcfA2
MEIVLFIAMATVIALIAQRLQKKRMYQYRESSFGKEKGTDNWKQEEESISCYHRTELSAEGIDNITWNDLELDRIYNDMNITQSNCGAEYLYALLRKPADEEKLLSERHQMSEKIKEDRDLRLNLQRVFFRLGKVYGASAYEMLLHCRTALHIPALFHVGIFLFTLIAIIALFINPWVGGCLCVLALFVSLYTYYKAVLRIPDSGRWYLKNFSKMLKAADKIVKINSPELKPYLYELQEILKCFRGVRLQSVFLASGTGIVSDAYELVLDYICILTHVDVLATGSITTKVRENFSKARRLFEILGFLDAMTAIANYKLLLPFYSVPEFVNEGTKDIKGFIVEELYHPDVLEPVPNSITATNGIVLTGSNASGKSTFLKAVALNGILAQTIYLSTSRRYQGYFCKVYTSMTLRDSIENRDSYFLAEIKSLKRILEASKKERVLCCIDEVFRGTNTPERIAASTEILESLGDGNTICLAATHDIELARLLQGTYDNYYFMEQVLEGEITFDYKLLKGISYTGNALKLLKAYGYPEDIVERAGRRLLGYQASGEWE